MAHAINRSDRAWRPGVFARLRQAFTEYREYRAIRDNLAAYNDTELADIGLSRLNVPDVAREAAYGN